MSFERGVSLSSAAPIYQQFFHQICTLNIIRKLNRKSFATFNELATLFSPGTQTAAERENKFCSIPIPMSSVLIGATNEQAGAEIGCRFAGEHMTHANHIQLTSSTHTACTHAIFPQCAMEYFESGKVALFFLFSLFTLRRSVAKKGTNADK